MHYAIQQPRISIDACFSNNLCFHLVCSDVLSPTEVVQLDASLLTILGGRRCNQGSNASVEFSLKLFHRPQ